MVWRNHARYRARKLLIPATAARSKKGPTQVYLYPRFVIEPRIGLINHWSPVKPQMRPAIEAGLMLLAGTEKAYMRPVLDSLCAHSCKETYLTLTKDQ
jgi:hypothetical protein